MVPFVFFLLTLRLVAGAPTAIESSGVAVVADRPVQPEDVILTNDTEDVVANETDTDTSTDASLGGLRGSIQKEIVLIRASFEKLRQDVDEWMVRRFRRTRLSRLTSCNLNGDKKPMLPKQDESDDDDL
ncbi:unnamed protein product [Heligmosomoides polygyrus]|uniref:RxLR effector candidate protein n=1 Tax=Heligmosomoides polygyrus TaxID=6339 RepID=A0A183FSS7_HELPZ|nr:unnamed protein product [Heligmosomoides polygyrus]